MDTNENINATWVNNSAWTAPDTTPPVITILSPEYTTYGATTINLNYTINEPTVWNGYSLDGNANVTITGNTTLNGLSDGMHNITVYANDSAGNMGSAKVTFYINNGTAYQPENGYSEGINDSFRIYNSNNITTTFFNTGETVYVRVITDKLGGSAPQNNNGKIKITLLNDSNQFVDDNNAMILNGTNRYTGNITLKSGWNDVWAIIEIDLKKGNGKFKASQLIKIGNAQQTPSLGYVKIYSDSNRTKEVTNWQLQRGVTYYLTVITSNLNNQTPDDKNKLEFKNYTNGDVIPKNDSAFSLSGNNTYYADFTLDNSFTVGYWYTMKIHLKNNNGEFKYNRQFLVV
ncbi:MAG: hypothetical protein ACE5J3_05760 [Methanosarcinales archaeon]